MALPEESLEDAGYHMPDGAGEGESEAREPGYATGELLAEVNAVAQHLRDLQSRLGAYGHRGGEEGPGGEHGSRIQAQEESRPPPSDGPHESPAAAARATAIIGAAEATAAEITARAEAAAAEILASAEAAGARIREEARVDERRLFEAIDALRPATAELQQALERVHDAAVAALMSYPPGG